MWRGALKRKFSLFDKRGLDADTVKTLRLLIVGVMGGVIWGNITSGVAMAGYLKQLQASDFLYGLVFALSPIANAFQFVASYRMERTLKRKRMFLISGFAQRLIWLPFALVPFIFPLSQAQLRLSAAVLCVAVSAAAAPFMNVSFYSICADVVPMRIRGRYFSTRNLISTFAGLIVGLLVGVLLDALPGFAGYCVVFCIAAVFGALDVLCFVFMPLPPMQKTPDQGGLVPMLRHVASDKRYMRIVLAMAVWNFTVQLSSPYFNVYQLDVLKMSNFSVMLLGQITSNVFTIIFVKRWGSAMDGFGNKPVLCVAALLTAFMPLMFFFIGEGMAVWIFLGNALSGATYCAIDLSAQNLFLGQARDDNKSMYFAVYFLFTQLFGLALGSSVGGWLLDNVLANMEAWNWTIFGVTLSRYNYLFLLSGVLRYLTIFLLLLRIAEEGAGSARELGAAMLRAVRNFFHGMVALAHRRRAHRFLRRERGKNGGQ